MYEITLGEHPMFGIEMPPPGELVTRYREAVELVDRLLRNDTTSYAGRFYQVREAPMRPLNEVRDARRIRITVSRSANGEEAGVVCVSLLQKDIECPFPSWDDRKTRGAVADNLCADRVLQYLL